MLLSRTFLPALTAAALLAASPAMADTVWVASGGATQAVERPNVKVEKVQNGQLFFRSSQTDRVTERPMEDVVRIMADGEPVFNAAEEAFAAGQWDKAAAGYQKAMASNTSRPWIRDRAGLRLVAAAAKSGKFPTAVAAWAALITRDATLAGKYKPQIPADAKPGSLDPALAEVEKALADAKLGAEPRKTLLAFQLELARANGDTKKAQSIGTKITRQPGAEAGPELALQLAKLALEQKQFDQALKEIEKAAPSITEPEQQVDALFVIAEARAALAKDQPAALKDAALAYMRVVTRSKSTRAGAARAAESMLKTAAIQEKLNVPQEALLLYQQAAEEYKGTEAATRAAEAADRLGKSAKAGA